MALLTREEIIATLKRLGELAQATGQHIELIIARNMKLPNGDRAEVEIEKLREYCLNSSHPRGKHKARVFKAALGLTDEDADALRDKLIEVAPTVEAELGEEDEHGRRYSTDFDLEWNEKKARVRATWIIRADEDFPRLTSCYVLKG